MAFPVDCLHLRRQEQPILDQKIQIDKIGIAGAGAAGLIGTVAETGLANGQKLPIMLSGSVQKIRKLPRRLSHGSDAVGRRKR